MLIFFIVITLVIEGADVAFGPAPQVGQTALMSASSIAAVKKSMKCFLHLYVVHKAAEHTGQSYLVLSTFACGQDSRGETHCT